MNPWKYFLSISQRISTKFQFRTSLQGLAEEDTYPTLEEHFLFLLIKIELKFHLFRSTGLVVSHLRDDIWLIMYTQTHFMSEGKGPPADINILMPRWRYQYKMQIFRKIRKVRSHVSILFLSFPLNSTTLAESCHLFRSSRGQVWVTRVGLRENYWQ